MAEKNLLTRQEVADLWGVSPSAVDNMVQAGKLQRAGRGVFDPAEVERARAAQDIGKRIHQTEVKLKGGQKAHKAKVEREGGDEPEAANSSRTAKIGEAMLTARAKEQISKATIAELNAKRLQGSMVESEGVKRDAFDCSRIMVQKLRALPMRLGPQLATLNDASDCIQLLEAEIANICEELQESLAAL